MQKELLTIHQFVQAFNKFAENLRASESLVDSVDEIAMQISNLLTKVGYNSISRRSFYELMTWQVPNVDCPERTMAMTDVVVGLSVNIEEDNVSLYKLNCYDIDTIYQIVYNSRDDEFGTLSSGNPEENYFIYPQERLLKEFLDKGILIRRSEEDNRIG